jgi:hypothetical protein
VTTQRRGRAVALAALAALAAWGILDPSRDGPPTGEPASPTVEAEAPGAHRATLRALHPAGSIPASPKTFVWTTDPEASAYEFELLGANQALLHSEVTSDTTLSLPRGVIDWNQVAGASWRVTPRYGSRQGVPSRIVRFRIESP